MLGPLPRREEFKRTLRDTVTADELAAFFLLPFSGSIPLEKLKKKAQKAKIRVEDLRARLDRLASEGFTLAYGTPEGPAYERGNPILMTEQQVRKPEGTPQIPTTNAALYGKIGREAIVGILEKSPGQIVRQCHSAGGVSRRRIGSQ